MTSEYELIKQFVEENKYKEEYFIPDEGAFLFTVANTPNYIRKYFEWKGQRLAVEALRKIAEGIKNGNI